jgi:hypothetical protein
MIDDDDIDDDDIDDGGEDDHDQKIIYVKMWLIQAYGLQETLKEGAAFAASNLRLKKTVGRASDCLECSAHHETTAFSMTGKTNAQRQALSLFKSREVVRSCPSGKLW